MKILNDFKGNINGRVHLTKEDAHLLHSALFYLLHEEPHEETKEKLNYLKQQFHELTKHLDDHED